MTKKYDLTPQEVTEAFVNAKIEEQYNFLQDDLMNLAQAFIDAAKPKLIKEERKLCIDVARSLNTMVAKKMAEIRGVK
jgi:hypothetical protein